MTQKELSSVLNKLYEFDSRITVQSVRFFMEIAKGSSFAPSELADSMGLTRPRVTQLINVYERDYGLIDYMLDPENHKHRIVSLNAKGKKFMKDLVG